MSASLLPTRTTMKKTLLTCLLLPLLTLTACQRETDAPATAPQDTAVGSAVRAATDKARAELASNPISISRDGQPKATITPEGDLLIDGTPVEINAVQRALLLEYRQGLEGIANAGMDIGVAGANLGLRAATTAVMGVLSGNADAVSATIEKDAERIKASAKALCSHLPAMVSADQALAAQLPAFAPYAGNVHVDGDGCDA